MLLTLLSELRAATGDLHRALDRSLGFLTENATQESYVAFLRGSLTALRSVEAAQADEVLSAAARHRARLISADLAALGAAEPNAWQGADLTLSTSARAWGARYVVEGSALGGAVLKKNLAVVAGRQGALSYLDVHGDGLRDHWRQFSTALDAWGNKASEAERADACAAACDVFRVYALAFAHTGASKTSP